MAYDTAEWEKKIHLTSWKKIWRSIAEPTFIFIAFVSVWVGKGIYKASHMPVQAICQNLALGKSSVLRLLLLEQCSGVGIVWKQVKS